MSKTSVLKRIDKEWSGLLESIAGLSDQDLLEPDVVGLWSIRDTLAHVTTWEDETLKALPLIMQDQTLPLYTKYGGIDSFNAREWGNKRNLTLHQVKDGLLATHRRLISFLEDLPESNFVSGKRFLRRLRLDTYNHYREHSRQIQAWRNTRGG